MNDWFQWAIVVFIILSILFHVWKGGAANPQTTGSLDRKVNALSGQVSALSGRVGHVESEMKELKESAASTKDIDRIEERIETVRAEAAGHRALSEATNRSVERIERVLIEKGLGGK